MTLRIAYFISPHGFGHAARASAIMGALSIQNPDISFDIFTGVPAWFFNESNGFEFTHFKVVSDIGIIQNSPLIEDLPETFKRLDEFYPLAAKEIGDLARTINERGCKIVLADICPLGIAVAKTASLPSVLIENFTWDWIYEPYIPLDPRMPEHIAYLQTLFKSADFHIQTDPICERGDPDTVDLFTRPASRKPRKSREEMRHTLEIGLLEKVVLVTMGGIPVEYNFLQRLEAYPDIHFIVAGGVSTFEVRNNLILLPHKHDYYHPDLVSASDAVIGKAGYSTIAEVFHAGIPFAYVSRERYRESLMLSDFIQKQMRGIEISGEEYLQGNWVERIPELISLPLVQRSEENGADTIARFILQMV